MKYAVAMASYGMICIGSLMEFGIRIQILNYIVMVKTLGYKPEGRGFETR
jgi:hypothetical protein